MPFSILNNCFVRLRSRTLWTRLRVFDAAGDAPGFAAAAHLPPLSEKQPEIRVWSQTALLGTLKGWVITGSEIHVYSNSQNIDGILKVDEDHVHLEKTVRSKEEASKLLLKFSRLANLDEKAIVCPVHDGSSLVIDGMAAGHHFSYTPAILACAKLPAPNRLQMLFLSS